MKNFSLSDLLFLVKCGIVVASMALINSLFWSLLGLLAKVFGA